jgi:hypothetical protein
VINVYKFPSGETQQSHFLISSSGVLPHLRVIPGEGGYRISLEGASPALPLSTEQAMIFALMLDRALAITRNGNGEVDENRVVAARIAGLEDEINELWKIIKTLVKANGGEATLPCAELDANAPLSIRISYESDALIIRLMPPPKTILKEEGYEFLG